VLNKSPAYDITAVQVDDGRQVHGPGGHRDVGDVYRPYLVGGGDEQPLEKVRVPIYPQHRQLLPGVYGHDAGFPHQPPNPLINNLVALLFLYVLNGQHTNGELLDDVFVPACRRVGISRIISKFSGFSPLGS
jgi:hypothetical protein